MQLPSRRGISFRAGIAEFLLILRLKSHRRIDRASDIPERAARIISVTCKNWFTDFNNFNDFNELAAIPKRGELPLQRCRPL